MAEIDIFTAKTGIEARLIGITDLHGMGISTNSINVYVSTQEAANEVIRKVGNNPYGYSLNIIRTDELKFL